MSSGVWSKLARRGSRGGRADSGTRLGLALLCVGLILVFGLTSDNFLTVSNGFAILLNVSSIAIAAIGSGFLLISGNVDLSIGGQYALLSAIAAIVARNSHDAVLAVVAT